MDSSPWTSLLTSFGIAVAGIVGAIVGRWLDRRKIQAETGHIVAQGADELVSAALRLLDEMKLDVAKLNEQVLAMECENRELKQQVAQQDALITELQQMLKELEDENAHRAHSGHVQ